MFMLFKEKKIVSIENEVGAIQAIECIDLMKRKKKY